MTHDEILTLYRTFVGIPSISTDSTHTADMHATVSFLQKELTSCGGHARILQRTNAHPLLCAHIAGNPRKPTIGIYAHYDVQPPDPLDQWESDPFMLTVKNSKMYGRGAADDKGHIIQAIAALKTLHETNTDHAPIICLFEGEEEVGSTSFEHYCEDERSLLETVDVWYVLDVGMSSNRSPQIYYGLRGLVYFELTVRTGARDVHSGIYGNRVINPIQVVTDLFAGMKDKKTQTVKIPGFYDDVRHMEQEELRLLEHASETEEELKQEAQVYRAVRVGKTPSYLSSKILPSLDINGIDGGYGGEGQKTIIPASVRVKFSCRLVEHQNPQRMVTLITNYIANHLPDGVEHTVSVLSSDPPFYTSVDNKFVRKTVEVLAQVSGKPVLFNRSGGSIPAAETLQRLFGKPVILTGFTMPDENIHAPNENFDEQNFWDGIVVLQKLLS